MAAQHVVLRRELATGIPYFARRCVAAKEGDDESEAWSRRSVYPYQTSSVGSEFSHWTTFHAMKVDQGLYERSGSEKRGPLNEDEYETIYGTVNIEVAEGQPEADSEGWVRVGSGGVAVDADATLGGHMSTSMTKAVKKAEAKRKRLQREQSISMGEGGVAFFGEAAKRRAKQRKNIKKGRTQIVDDETGNVCISYTDMYQRQQDERTRDTLQQFEERLKENDMLIKRLYTCTPGPTNSAI